MNRFPLIDVLRAFAALLVVSYHVVVIGEWKSFPVEGVIPLLVRIGWVGVDLFFVISGFVIGKSAIDSALRDPGGWRAGFARRRWFRIAPLYFLTALAFVFLVNPAVLLQGWQHAAIHLGSHALFVHNLSPETHGSINGPNWSVALEMQFYLLMLISGAWIARARLWVLVPAFVGVALLWRWGTTWVLTPGVASNHVQHVAVSQLPGVLDQFVLGILVARLVVAKQLRMSWLHMAVAGAVAAVALGIAWRVFWSVADYWSSAGMIIGWRGLVGVGCAALVAAAAASPVGSALWLKPVRYLGEISYGIYLWHLPILLTLLAKTPWRGLELLIAVVACTLVMASFSWHMFEAAWLNRGAQSSSPNPPKV